MWALLSWECGLPARKGVNRQARCLRSQGKSRTGAPDEDARGRPEIPLRWRASPLLRGIEENGERGGSESGVDSGGGEGSGQRKRQGPKPLSVYWVCE